MHTGGSGPYTYSIVPSFSSSITLPLEDYVVPPQESKIFDGLAAGTYYVRIQDACGGYDTKTATISTNEFAEEIYHLVLSNFLLTK